MNGDVYSEEVKKTTTTKRGGTGVGGGGGSVINQKSIFSVKKRNILKMPNLEIKFESTLKET